jgi:uncharacterized phage protein gp47/JayE
VASTDGPGIVLGGAELWKTIGTLEGIIDRSIEIGVNDGVEVAGLDRS